MSRPLPTSAAAGLSAFGPKIAGALLLRPSFYRATAADRDAWRPAAAMVALSSIATDALRTSDLDHFLTLALGNWIFIAIMLLAGVRWAFATAVAWVPLRLLSGNADYSTLLRCLGFAHAPGLLRAAPVLLSAFGIAGAVTPLAQLLSGSLVSLWMIAAFTVAVRAATPTSVGRGLSVALATHFAILLFDAALDAALFAAFAAASR